MKWRQLTAISLSAFALCGFGYSAQANNLVLNGGFETYTGASNPKNQFQKVAPTDWSCAQCGVGGRVYTFVDAPGTATSGNGGYAVYPGLPPTSPDGGNFIQADGDSKYRATISQDISGLVIGDKYLLTFWQAAGQQTTFNGATTEQWQVNIGGDPAQSSPLMTNPSHDFQPWEQVSMSFTATATSELLKFLAIGTPNNLPPTVFLDGVDIEATTPVSEPAALSLMGVGILGLGAVGLRRRAKRTAAV